MKIFIFKYEKSNEFRIAICFILISKIPSLKNSQSTQKLIIQNFNNFQNPKRYLQKNPFNKKFIKTKTKH